LKKSKTIKRSIALVVTSILLLTNFSATQIIRGATAEELKLELQDYYDRIDNYSETIKYSTYYSSIEDKAYGSGTYTIEANSYTQVKDMEVEEYVDFENMEGASILTQEEGAISYEVDIKEAGRYNMSLLYYPVVGKSSSIQRAIFIDGELPFSEMSNIEFERIWDNQNETILRDNQGNDLRPAQVEQPKWVDSVVEDFQGYYSDPFEIYLEEGIHTITLLSQREPMMLRQIKLYKEALTPTYEEVKQTYKDNSYQEATNSFTIIQAEDAVRKSSQMLYPLADHSTPAVYPYAAKEIRINTLGGNNWRDAGQWVEWDVNVEADGLYKIGMNVKQNFVRGIYTSRKLKIDGVVPFEEVKQIPFTYNKDWRLQEIGIEDEPYLFYLTKGVHTLRMEVVLGDLAPIIREAELGVRNMNEIYRDVLMVTGSTPDQYRDYQIEATIPEIVNKLRVEKKRMDSILSELELVSGQLGDREAGLVTLRDQLVSLIKDVEKMPKKLNQFKVNIGALGTWITQIISQPLQLDSLYVMSPEQVLPELNDSFWDKLLHEIKMLFYSFIIDYNAIGNVAESGETKTITVWVGTGRDQANTMKALIDENFTKKTGINVNLMLVDMSTLLPATLSGEGPDVAMQVGNDLPMNYGMRNAVADLSGFEGFDTVTKEFYESALLPYRFEDKCFALPEQQTFSMLFYRKDILKDLGITPPKTWDEVKVSLSVLSKNQMAFGMLPSSGTNANSGMLPVAETIFGIFLYQNGAEFYLEDGKESGLSTDKAITAFKEFTKYYTDYTLDREFDPVNRFRTGEMPMIIADYTTYNTLQVSAPEIKGLWEFTTIPGTVQEDGSIRNDVPSSGSSCVMMEGSDDKDLAWEYMKWWVSTETQLKYGREMEGLMGPAARYPTANIEAFLSLPWPVNDLNALSEQFKVVRGIPQVPGGYFTMRHVNNAFYQVVVAKDIEPRESLMNYVRYIDDEIDYKRAEFGLTQ